MLQAIGEDLARPAVQARNLFHFSLALYDSWAAYDPEAETYLLGKTVAEFTCPCKEIPVPTDREAAQKEAMSFAAYRLLTARFTHSPNSGGALSRFQEVMDKHGYDYRDHSTDYSSGSPAALGNYLAQCILQMGRADKINETSNYRSDSYRAINPPLDISQAGNPSLLDPNRWQALKVNAAIDLDGHPMAECRCGGKPLIEYDGTTDPSGRQVTTVQTFQCPDWGRVQPFALTGRDRTVYQFGAQQYWVFHDPGTTFLPRLDTLKAGGTTHDYRWNFALTAVFSALLDPADGVVWDVSPGKTGNLQGYPQNLPALRDFLNLETGRDNGAGHPVNPRTGQPYAPQLTPRGEFVRVAAQFWAEGPNRETAAGQWFTILNYISDQPGLAKKFNGKGRLLSDLEWDVKAYFVLGGALHDAAIAAWSIKSRYNSIRPVSALRFLAQLGQSADPGLPHYHPAGLPLMPGRIELVKKGDPLAGSKRENVGKLKFYAWRGPVSPTDSTAHSNGVGWMLAENWLPFQSKTFVSPPYAGYVSEHAVFSHAASEVLTLLTGDGYFPGGLGAFEVAANSNFLSQEKGPGVDIRLQWATYRDAADQASLSRIWAGTNTLFEDIPGRLIGDKTGVAAFNFAKTYFYRDRDGDGFLSFEDCDDANPAVYPCAPELCDGLDNDCNGKTDDGPPCPDRHRGICCAIFR
ncbi:MAG: hypothetical protein JNK89_09740 [Saprospiraceae bacterium]|nr:hypothetical protein [Saprospiraceae bacterium]